jgi:hypothetical protein
MDNNEIIIICNSPQCLAEITSGNYPNLANQNIFTCNLAYSYFRTTGQHYNIFTDIPAITDFLYNPNWYGIYSTNPYNKVIFVINNFTSDKPILLVEDGNNRIITEFGIKIPASSGMAALFYLVKNTQFKKITLLGYTLNEWEGIEHNNKLQNKVKMFEFINQNYKVNNPRPFVYEYEKIYFLDVCDHYYAIKRNGTFMPCEFCGQEK